jgi:hypothetical protein
MNVADNEKMPSQRAPLDVDIRTIKASEVLETLGRNKKAYFFMHLSDYTFQGCFSALAMSAK